MEKMERYKYIATINVMAFAVVLACLVAISYTSLMQTISAFLPFSDPTLVGGLGLTLPVVLGCLFQYGQNVALYVRKNYRSDRPMIDNAFEWLTMNNISMVFFVICAIVDGATNIIWFETVVMSKVAENMAIYRVVGWIGMSLIVFVEETVGITMQAFSRAWRELKSIKESERRMKNQQPHESHFRPDRTEQRPNRPIQSVPVPHYATRRNKTGEA